MPVIGITGGVASGKSTVVRILAEQLVKWGAKKVETLSADDIAHELLESNSQVRENVRHHFGSEVFLSDGKTESTIDRAALRDLVFAHSAKRKTLEEILHPEIRRRWTEKAEDFRSSTCYLVVEIPLLFETQSEDYFDRIVVVDADIQSQLERLSSKRGWSLEIARQVIDAQMPALEKMQRAHLLILNHYTQKLLADQVTLAARTMLLRYA